MRDTRASSPSSSSSSSLQRWMMVVLAAILLAWMANDVVRTLREALPGRVTPAAVTRLVLEPGQSAWQTFYLPACGQTRLELDLLDAVGAPGAVAIAWFAVDDPARWPAVAASESTIVLDVEARRLSVALPASPEMTGRLVGLRLTADRTTVVLPATREDVVRTGYLTRRPGYISTDDLAFRIEDGERGLAAGLACVTRGQPPTLQRPLALAGALVTFCAAFAWLAGLGARTTRREG